MKFKDKIEKYAKKHDIDPAWLAFVVKKESNFEPEARRYEKHHDERGDKEPHRDAFKQFQEFSDLPNQDDERWEDDASYGLCQIMGSTAIWLGWKPESDKGFHELFDPATNLDLGAQYLSHLYSKYPEIRQSEMERLRMATGAFNAGRGNINKMLDKARMHESSETGESISIEDNGEWQTWSYSSQFLKDVTGEWSNVTLQYIRDLNDLLPEYRRRFAEDFSIDREEYEEDLKRVKALRDEVKRVQINLTQLANDMERRLEG